VCVVESAAKPEHRDRGPRHDVGVTVYGTLGDLSDAQLQAALDRFILGRLVSAEAFGEGLFGKNVGIVTDAGRWVLRGHPWPANSDEQFRRERFWASSIRQHCDVPVPWPFHIDDDESLLGWPYQLTPWMPGTHERNAVGAAALGRAAAKLRAVTFDSFGDWSPEADAIEPFAGNATEWLAKRTDAWTTACAAGPRPLLDSDRAFVHALIPDDLDVVPTYVHHDLKIDNCVFLDGEVSGLFDLGEGVIGDPVENLARAVWDLARFDVSLAATFLHVYEDAAGVAVPLARLRSYVMLDLLVIWEFAVRQTPPWVPAGTFQSWVTSFIAPVDLALDAGR
jgi:hygromycin-B 7''-O-kinase